MRIGNARRWALQRERRLVYPAFLGTHRSLQTLFNRAHRFEVFVKARLVVLASLAPQRLRLIAHEIEHARLITLERLQKRWVLWIGAGDYSGLVVTEQAIE